MSDTPAWASRSPDDRQALAQRRHRRMARAEPQRGRLCAHLRPAALGDDALELRDRLLGVLHGRRRQRRQRRLRHLDGARGGIEALAEIAALVLVDQRLRARRPGRRRARPRGRRPRARSPAQGGAARRAGCGWRWSGDLVIAVPEAPKPPNPRAGSAFSRSQTRRARQVPDTSNLRAAGKGGAGRICDECRDNCVQTHQTPGGGNPGGLVAAEDGGDRPAVAWRSRAGRGSGRSRTARAGAATCSGSRTRRR